VHNQLLNKFHLEFWDKLAHEYEVVNNPKFEKLKNIAWDRGHSEGYYEVLNIFEELVELIK